MIVAEKVEAKGKYWVKATFEYNVTMFGTMQKVRGAVYNPATATWALPWENKDNFEQLMGDFLIVWVNEDVTAGGISEDKIPDYPVVPYEFKTKPFPFQIKGFNLMVTRPFLILADDAGLGKSLQVATAMEARKQLGQVNHGVILCKASLLFNWRDEIHMHTNCKAVVVAGSLKQRSHIYNELYYSDDWTFLIISYSTFRGDVATMQWLDTERGLDFCVC